MEQNFVHIIKPLYLACGITLCALFSGCKEKDPQPIVEPDYTAKVQAKSAVLLYAVASNNLESSYRSDLAEIKEGAADIDLDTHPIYVYRVTYEGNPGLFRLVRKPAATQKGSATQEEELTWIQLKEYDRKQFSTDPARIKEVLTSITKYVETDNLGLILWSHGTGWIPDFKDHDTSDIYPPEAEAKARAFYSFGYDDNQGVVDTIDVNQLSDAIPSGIFKYIWFDCCYMSAIENIYQLRDKADYIVSYPTEVWGDGMPYNLTIPLMLADTPNLVGAADQLFTYYDAKNLAVTVSIVETQWLDRLAAECAKVYTTTSHPDIRGVHDYGRFKLRQFYDLGQYTRRRGSEDATWTSTSFDEALQKCVIYKKASRKDFSSVEIEPQNYSGLTIHPYEMTTGRQATFYQTLDWYFYTWGMPMEY